MSNSSYTEETENLLQQWRESLASYKESENNHTETAFLSTTDYEDSILDMAEKITNMRKAELKFKNSVLKQINPENLNYNQLIENAIK